MKGILIFLTTAILWPLSSQAQLGKLMSKYHEKEGITVTQLDKSLYGLYERDNLSTEAREMLQNLEEVNLLSLNFNSIKPDNSNKLITQFRQILDNPSKYKLMKSRNEEYDRQLIYTQSKDGKVTDLVVWNQNPERLDIIELRGDIQLNKLSLLSRALNIRGLNSLASLSSGSAALPGQAASPEDFDFTANLRRLQEMMQQDFDFDPAGMMARFFGTPDDTSRNIHPGIPDPLSNFMAGTFFGDAPDFSQLEELIKNGTGSHKIEKYFQSFGNGDDISSNSVEITEENGKTKLKINSQNSDITYIIDGEQAPKENVQMPEKIVNVNMIGSREDVRKSYLFITSGENIGSFKSYKDGVLTFTYKEQEYKYNLDKARHPLLVINGRLSSTFNIDPSAILQIRPVSQIEKEVGYYPNAEVIINTK